MLILVFQVFYFFGITLPLTIFSIFFVALFPPVTSRLSFVMPNGGHPLPGQPWHLLGQAIGGAPAAGAHPWHAQGQPIAGWPAPVPAPPLPFDPRNHHTITSSVPFTGFSGKWTQSNDLNYS